jgi:hypothetical protein
MANTLTNIMPKILARGLMALRQRVIMPRLVNGDYSQEAAQKGDVINVPIPAAQTASDVTPSNTPPVPASEAPGVVQIPLDNWKHSDFHLTDKELTQIDRQAHFIPMQMEEAIKALANAVNQDIFDEYKGVFGFVGTPGTTPFATDVVIATTLRKTLNQQLCPRELRRVVLNFDAEANALALAPFRDTSQSSDREVIIEGEIGRKFGMDWYADDHVPTHTAGTGAGYLINNGAGYAPGATTVVVDTGTGTILVGDIVTFAGHAQTYVVTSALAANQFSFYPGLQAAVADNAAVTLKASHVVNLGFHRNAIAFATRPLASTSVELQLGNQIMSMQDPKSGIVLRLEVSRQYKQTVWDFDILWGAKLVRPELAVRLAG